MHKIEASIICIAPVLHPFMHRLCLQTFGELNSHFLWVFVRLTFDPCFVYVTLGVTPSFKSRPLRHSPGNSRDSPSLSLYPWGTATGIPKAVPASSQNKVYVYGLRAWYLLEYIQHEIGTNHHCATADCSSVVPRPRRVPHWEQIVKKAAFACGFYPLLQFMLGSSMALSNHHPTESLKKYQSPQTIADNL